MVIKCAVPTLPEVQRIIRFSDLSFTHSILSIKKLSGGFSLPTFPKPDVPKKKIKFLFLHNK